MQTRRQRSQMEIGQGSDDDHAPHNQPDVAAKNAGNYGVNTGIIAPKFSPTEFKLKQDLMEAMQNYILYGRPNEDPLDHLDDFDRLCNLYKTDEIPLNTIRMIMFTFSLANEAMAWERRIPSRLVSTWDDVKIEFLTSFFPERKATEIKDEITSFEQWNDETIGKAWERFKRYMRACPHHGFSERFLMETFYKGCNIDDQLSLDSTSKGDFSDRTIREKEKIITDYARVCDMDYEEEYGLGEITPKIS